MTAANHVDRIDGNRLLYSVSEAARLLGVGRTYMFRLLSLPPCGGHPTCQAVPGGGSSDGTASPAVLAGI
jgi:hypothetical protein